MTAAEKFFFELVKISVGQKDSLSAEPTPEEWAEIYDIARKQTLIGVIYEAIEKLPKQQLPPKKLLLQWFVFTEEVKRQNEKLNRCSSLLTRNFSDHNRETAILKGQGVACYYPQPLMRMSGDIDVWVNGSRKEIISFLEMLNCELGEIVYHHVDAHLFKSVEVEVHFRPTWLWNPFDNKKLQLWFRKNAKAQMHNEEILPGNNPITTPHRDFNAVFLLIHIYRHLFFEGIGLRQLMDYYYCLLSPGDNIYVAKVLKDLHLTGFASAVMYVLQQVFGLDEHYFIIGPNEKTGGMLLEEIMLAGNFGQYDLRQRHDIEQGTAGNLLKAVKRNLRFFRFYYHEIIWEVPFKVVHYIWRKFVNKSYAMRHR